MNYNIENKGGVNLLHIGDTVRPATDAEVDLVAQLQRANDCIHKIRLRLHFTEWPGESMWDTGDGHWVADWRYEAQLIDSVLFGSEIRTPEKPTDTRKRYDVLFRPQRVYVNAKGDAVLTQLPLRDWPEWARNAMPEGVTGPTPTVQIINGDVVGIVSDEQIHVVLMDALHRIAERNGYPEWAHFGPSSDVFEAYKTWPEDLRARPSVNDLRRMSGWKPQSKEDQVTDALEGAGVIDAHQAMDRRVAAIRANREYDLSPEDDCRCVDCGGTEPGHSKNCKYMAELHGADVRSEETRVETPVEAWNHPDTLRLDWIIQKATDSYTGVTLDASKKKGSRIMWHHHALDYSSIDLRQAIDRGMRNGD